MPLLADLLPKVIKLDLLATERSGRLLSKAVRRCMHIYNPGRVLQNSKGETFRKRNDGHSLDWSPSYWFNQQHCIIAWALSGEHPGMSYTRLCVCCLLQFKMLLKIPQTIHQYKMSVLNSAFSRLLIPINTKYTAAFCFLTSYNFDLLYCVMF